MTNKHKAYAAVLGLAALVLGYDQLFLAPDTGAALARAAEITPAGPTTADLTPTIEAISLDRDPTFADRLTMVAKQRKLDVFRIEDAFDPPQAWAIDEKFDLTAKSDRMAPENFERRHRLNMVIGAGTHGVATIDGQPVRIGQSIDGLRLVRVAPRSAVLEKDGMTVTLAISDNTKSENKIIFAP